MALLLPFSVFVRCLNLISVRPPRPKLVAKAIPCLLLLFTGIGILFQVHGVLASPGPPPPKTVAVFSAIKKGELTPLWTFKTEHAGYHHAEVFNQKLYLHDSMEHILMQVEPRSGTVAWRLKVGEGDVNDYWRPFGNDLSLDSTSAGKLIVINDALLVNEKNGEVLGRAESNGAFEIQGDYLLQYADCSGHPHQMVCHRIIRHDPVTGKEVWSAAGFVRTSRRPLRYSNLHKLGSRYLLNLWEGATLFDGESGRVLWTSSAKGNVSWEELNPFSRKDAVLLTDRSVILKSGQRYSSNGGKFAQYLVALDVDSGLKQWEMELTRDQSPSSGIRQYQFIDLYSGIAFYDGISIRLLNRNRAERPTVVWPSNPALAEQIDISSLIQVGKDSLIAATQQLDKKGGQILRVEASGEVPWIYQGANVSSFTPLAMNDRYLRVQHEEYDNEIVASHRLDTKTVAIDLENGQVLQHTAPTEELTPIPGLQGTSRNWEKWQNEMNKFADIVRTPAVKMGTISFVNPIVTEGAVTGIGAIGNVQDVGEEIVIASGIIQGSQEKPGPPPPNTSNDVLALLDSGKPHDVLRGIEAIDRHPKEAKKLLTHATQAILRGGCRNYSCVGNLWELTQVDSFDAVVEVLTKGSGKDLDNTFRELIVPKTKALPLKRRKRLVKLALRSLSDSYAPIRWDAAWFLMFMDEPIAKEKLAAHRRKLIESLTAEVKLGPTTALCGCGTQADRKREAVRRAKGDTAREIGYLKGCGKAAWRPLLKLATQQLTEEEVIDQDVVQALESLAGYQTDDPALFVSYVKQAVDLMKRLTGYKNSRNEYPFHILISTLARHPHPATQSLLIQLLKSNDSGESVAQGLKYSRVKMSADDAKALLQSSSTLVTFIAARAAIDFPDRSAELAEPAIRSLLRFDAAGNSHTLERLLTRYGGARAVDAVAAVAATASLTEKVTLLDVLNRLEDRSIYKALVLQFENDRHEEIRRRAKLFIEDVDKPWSGRGGKHSLADPDNELEAIPKICSN